MMLMKTIAPELAPRGIRVNGLAPGAARTPINTAAWSTPEAYEALMRLAPTSVSASRKTCASGCLACIGRQ